MHIVSLWQIQRAPKSTVPFGKGLARTLSATNEPGWGWEQDYTYMITCSNGPLSPLVSCSLLVLPLRLET